MTGPSTDQAVRHAPVRSVRCTVVTGFQGPAAGRSKCSVTRALTACGEDAVVIRPALLREPSRTIVSPRLAGPDGAPARPGR